MTIQEWAAGTRDYWQGVALFKSLSRNSALAKAFDRGPNRYNIDKLAYELDKLRAVEPSPVQAVPPDSGPAAPPVITEPQALAPEKKKSSHQARLRSSLKISLPSTGAGGRPMQRARQYIASWSISKAWKNARKRLSGSWTTLRK